MNRDSNIVVGLGEVGGAIREVLECGGHDPFKNILEQGHFDVMHIAFPWAPSKYDFIEEVKKYKALFTPSLIIIHSTVPLGTSDKVGAVHSPIRGVHPYLAPAIKTFVKFFGGKDAERAAQIFKDKGVRTVCCASARDTEAAKLWDTTQYGAMIILNQEIYKYCEENHVDFNTVYTEFNKTYIEGYHALGRTEIQRPYLKYIPGPIGGHCVVQNSYLLESETPKRIIEKNNELLKKFPKSPYVGEKTPIRKPSFIARLKSLTFILGNKKHLG